MFVTAKNEMAVTLEPGDSVILTRWGVIGPDGLRGASQPNFATICGRCAALHTPIRGYQTPSEQDDRKRDTERGSRGGADTVR